MSLYFIISYQHILYHIVLYFTVFYHIVSYHIISAIISVSSHTSYYQHTENVNRTSSPFNWPIEFVNFHRVLLKLARSQYLLFASLNLKQLSDIDEILHIGCVSLITEGVIFHNFVLKGFTVHLKSQCAVEVCLSSWAKHLMKWGLHKRTRRERGSSLGLIQDAGNIIIL